MLYRVDDWDEAYANAAHIAQGDSYPDRWRKAAAAFRASHVPIALQGGDLFRPRAGARGLMIFIHGGYWMDFAPSDWSHLAAGALERGWACLMPAYPLAPRARIAEMTRTVAAGIIEAAALVAGPVAITGHSAGGHLAARMICVDVLPDAVANRIRTCMPISPLSDLRPLMRTAMNDTLALDLAEACAESPALLSPRPEIPVSVWVGGAERPEFLRQARLLADIWAGLGAATECVVDPGRHHFNIVAGLADPDSAMMRRLLDGAACP